MKIKMHWDRQAGKGEKSGTQDRIAKHLEMEAISRYVADGMRVLDVGCGDGETLKYLRGLYGIKGTGVDYSQEMIFQAIKEFNHPEWGGSLDFIVWDVKKLKELWNHQEFNLIYTERTLINLSSWEEQRQAIIDIGGLLKSGGLYLMCECFKEGLRDINSLRQAVSLQPIQEPWHNCYLSENRIINELGSINLTLEDRLDYSANYYFLSRVVNAYAAAQSAVAIDYNSPINHLAMYLPYKVVNMRGQGQLWVWRKK